MDSINRPEQLDRLLTLTSARSWIALMAIAVLLAVALVWSVTGRLPTYVKGPGLFLRQEGSVVAAAAAHGNGTLAKVMVVQGDYVEANQVVARIVAPEVEQKIANVRELILQREEELRRQRDLAAREMGSKSTVLNRRETALGEVLRNAQRREDALQKSLADQHQLKDAGIVTRNAVLQAQAEYDRAVEEVADTEDQIAQVDIQLQDLSYESEQRVKNAEYDMADAQRQLSELIEAYRADSEVRAPVAGTVDEVQARAGSLMASGQSVLTIETAGRGLGYVLFASLRDGEKIQLGQAVRVSPNWTIREEEGTMLGKVKELSRLPMTPEGLRALLHNEELVRHFSSAGPVFMVNIELQHDAATRSGYAWTSSKGAQIHVDSGSFGEGEVLIKSQAPISLAIPALRRWIGI